MTWKFKPTPKESESYLFDGIYIVEPSVVKAFSPSEIQSAFKLVFDTAHENNGLAPVQNLTHTTSGKVIQMIHSLSQEMKAELIEGQPEHEELINELGDILVMFSNEKPTS
jgi:hypothetical protein